MYLPEFDTDGVDEILLLKNGGKASLQAAAIEMLKDEQLVHIIDTSIKCFADNRRKMHEVALFMTFTTYCIKKKVNLPKITINRHPSKGDGVYDFFKSMPDCYLQLIFKVGIALKINISDIRHYLFFVSMLFWFYNEQFKENAILNHVTKEVVDS
jgi:hypothetical protein